ncbi:MAG: phosphate butyryltransferase [Chlorobiaceae bacterium]|nr:phosphate butyryltransferase [Chlorobiaceae bacterium]
MIKNFEELINAAQQIKNKKVVVVFPNNEETLSAVNQACEEGIANFILVGNEEIIRKKFLSRVPKGVEIINDPEVNRALEKSIELIRRGEGDILLKGGVDTGTLMKAVLQDESGIRSGRLLSDVFIFEYPSRIGNKLIMITDGGLTLVPNLKEKVELINNAVEVAHALGNANPKVAVLSATEFVNPKLQSTVDAAELTRMNESGQIKGCTVHGPLALDNAVSVEAAEEKGIKSPVAGNAEILILPNIEAANIFAKGTTYFAGYRLAHVIIGGRIPILIPSRADKSDAKMLSIALGKIMCEYYTRK